MNFVKPWPIQTIFPEAHVGVGISGVEGTAATNSADYAIGVCLSCYIFLVRFSFSNKTTTKP